MNKTTNILFSLLVAIILLAPARAHAQCSNPAGVAGDQIYNTSFNVMQYCDGTDWVGMGSSGKATSSIWQTSGSNIFYDLGYVGIGTTTPTSTLHVAGGITAEGEILLADEAIVIACTNAGAIRYNTVKASIEVCDGTTWKTSSAGGFTQGSVPFANAQGDLIEDNPNLNWNTANKELTVGNMITFKGEIGDKPIINNPMIGDLDNVDISNPSDGHVLTYDAGGWKNLANDSIWQENVANIYFNTGYVGIGEVTPLKELHISGPSNPGISIGTDATDRGSITWSTTDNFLAIQTRGGLYPVRLGNGDNSVHVDVATGKVGIGNISPSAQLHIGNDDGTGSSGVGEIARLKLSPPHHTGGDWEFLARDNTPTSGLAYLDISYDHDAYDDGLTLTSDGKVGIGTKNPTATLDIQGDINLAGSIYGGQYGATKGIWRFDLTYPDHGIFYKEASPDVIYFSPSGGGDTTPDMTVDGSGHVTISKGQLRAGPDAPLSTFYNISTSTFGARNSIYSYGYICAGNSSGACTGSNGVVLRNDGWAGKVGGGSWGSTSDIRLKKDIAPLEKGLEEISLLNPVSFKWINPESHSNETRTLKGFIAQEVMEHFPSWVTEQAIDGKDKELVGKDKAYTLTLPFDFDALTVKAIQELDQKNKQLEARIEELEKLIKEQK